MTVVKTTANNFPANPTTLVTMTFPQGQVKLMDWLVSMAASAIPAFLARRFGGQRFAGKSTNHAGCGASVVLVEFAGLPNPCFVPALRAVEVFSTLAFLVLLGNGAGRCAARSF
jgi:hypothetical protein